MNAYHIANALCMSDTYYYPFAHKIKKKDEQINGNKSKIVN